MVYPSLPPYLDPPNWNLQQQQQLQLQPSNQIRGPSSDGRQLLLPPLPPRSGQEAPGSARSGTEGSNATGAARPAGSMTERARLAKVPQPDQAMKCPRCDSTNTKFCYFNNYSLSQPRHFCKTCRRYWTRGGTLRNVPVGGGCRRNKRSKSGTSGGSKSSTSGNNMGVTSTVMTTTSSSTSFGIGGDCSSYVNQPPQHIPFLGSSSLHPLSEYGQTSLGLNYGVIPNVHNPVFENQYQIGGGSGSIGLEQWRLHQLQQQIPFFAGLEQQQHQQQQPQHQQQQTHALGLFSFDGDNIVDVGTTFAGQQGHGKATAAGLITQLASVKMEESGQQRLHLSRQFLGLGSNNNMGNNDGQYWSNSAGAGASIGGSTSTGIGWNDLSAGFDSSSTGNLL